MVKIDLKDKKILYQLDTNSRQSLSQIGKKVGLHENVVGYRIKRMEKLGVIKGYYTVIDSYKLNYIVLRLYINLQYVTPAMKKEIINYFITNKHTWVVDSTISGSYDLVVFFWVRDINEFYQIWINTLDTYGKHIQEYFISLYIKAIFYRPNYLLNEKERTNLKSFIITGGDRKIEISDKDFQLITLLSSNARIPVNTMAQQLDLTVPTVRKKIKQLEKASIIQGYRVNIDHSWLNLRGFKIEVYLKDHNRRKIIISYIEKNPHIYCLNITTHPADLELECYFENIDSIKKFMGNLIEKFPDDIKHYRYFIFGKKDKISYLPER